MTTPQNPDGFDVDTFSPAPRHREASLQEIVDSIAGFEPKATAAYPFRGRTFIELHPYDEE